MRTREQKYAAAIYDQVLPLAGKPKAERRQYGSMAHKLPVLIRTAGLAQSLAFVAARGSRPQKLLLDHLATIVMPDRDGAALLDESRQAEFLDYLRLTQKVMAALVWYKRYAQSVLGVQQGDQEAEDGENVDGEPEIAGGGDT